MATEQFIFNDGTFYTVLSRHFVSIGLVDGHRYDVPNGHAWYDRVREATTRCEVEGYYLELDALLV
jgi:hypothetical protein